MHRPRIKSSLRGSTEGNFLAEESFPPCNPATELPQEGISAPSEKNEF